MRTHETINNVNVTEMRETIKAVEVAPRLADFTFRVDNEWVTGAVNRSTIKGFRGAGQEDTSRPRPFVYTSDEPRVLFGKDYGANPIEFVLHGLAACLTTSLVFHASARGIGLDEITSHLEGDLDVRGWLGVDDSIRNGLDGVRISFNVKGKASQEELDELVVIAQQRSPVFDIISNPVPVAVTVGREEHATAIA